MQPGRHDPCPCGSGRKYKHCCGRLEASAPAARERPWAAHNSHGLTLIRQARRAEAAASFRQALALEPNYVEALANLANVLRELGERDAALALYQQAVALAPQRPALHCSVGIACFELRRIGEAAASFRRTLELDATYLQAQLGLATVLRVQGSSAAAEAACEAALVAAPHSAAAASLLGELRADRGRFDDAQELFQRAIGLDRGCATAYFGIAQHRKMTDADGAWRAGVEALLARSPALAEEISLRYALGKYCDDTGRYEEAFASYRQANELARRCSAGYDRGALTRRIDRIIATCDAEFMRRAHAAAQDSELPVLIVGMPRSGTSLTEQILASHPSVFGAGELHFWDDAFTSLERAQGGEEAAALLPAMAREYLARLSALGGAHARVIDKLPGNFLYAGLIHAVFPRARILHMRRHPLDTCLSIYFQNFFNLSPCGNDLESLAHYYREYLRITAHWRSLLPSSAWLEIPYESLIADQEQWTRRLLDFLGLPWDPRCLDFDTTDRVVLTASRWQVRQKITTASAGRWRNYEKFIGPLAHLVDLVRDSEAAAGAPQPMRVASSRPSSSA